MARAVYIGRYKVIEEIGRGGMGIVYRGEDPVLERPVAIKVLPPKKTAQKKAVQRFLREARVSARLDHPHIVKVYDIGEEDGIYHIVMEYVPGDSLRDILEREINEDADVDIRAASAFFRQLCSALAYAHGQKITHRDIKPENVKITEDGKVKLMDFGIAVLDDSHSITEAGSMMGTIAYFSPEQARGAEADYRADIYSLGVVFYEMLTLCLPFEAASIPEMIHKHLHSDPVKPSKRNPAIPEVLEKLILRCLEKEPERRYQSAAEMEKYITGYLDGVFDQPASPPPVLEDLKQELRAHLDSLVEPDAESNAYQKTAESYNLEGKFYSHDSGDDDDPSLDYTDNPEEYNRKTGIPVIPPLAGTIPAVPVVASQPLASNDWLASASGPSFEKKRYNEFLDKMKKDAASVKETVMESSSVVCTECGQENYAGQIECSRCAADLTAAHYSGRRGAHAYNSQGMSLLESGDYKQAATNFEEAIKCDSEFAPARINLARAFMESGDTDKALTIFSEVLQLFPGRADTHVYRAECFRRRDEHDFAIDDYLKALTIEPNNIESRINLAFLYTNKGKLSKAINEYRYVLSLDPDNIDVHRQLGYIYAGLEQTDDAIREFEHVIRLDPGNAQVYTWLGDLYKKRRRFAQAEKSYHTSISINPEDISTHNGLGDLYLKQNRDDMAYRTFREALSIEENKEAYLQLADMYVKHSDPEGAISELEKVVRMYPGESSVHQKLGDLYMSLECYSEALEHYEKSVTESPTADAHNRLGLLYLKKDYAALSVIEYRKAVEMQPGKPEFREDLGMAYYCQGHRDKAIEELKKAVTLDSRNVDYYKAIGVMLEEEGRYDEAIRMLQKAQVLSPRDSLIPALIGKVYFTQGLVSMALVEYQKALALQPTNYLYHIYIAKAYTKKHQTDMAIEYFRKAIMLMPPKGRGEYDSVMGRAYMDLGRAHIDKGEFEKAREILMSAEKFIPDDSSLMFLIGVACLNERRYSEAHKYLSAAIHLEPDNPNIIVELTKCCMLRGEYDSAIKMCRALLAMLPDRADLKDLMVDIYIKAGRFPEARQFAEDLSAVRFMGSHSHYLKAKIAGAKKDFLLAEKEYAAAFDGDPDNWLYASGFALFLKSRARFEEAYEYIKVALENSPGGRQHEQLLAESNEIESNL